MKMRSKLSLLVAAGLCSGSVQALTDLETNASLPFSFVNPGARSLGMGGAFLGLADDATAAYTNPAGLTQLSQREISLEVRRTSYDIPYLNGGAVTQLNPYDVNGLNYSDSSSSKNGVSFISFVFPRDRWAIAAYRHESSRYQAAFQSNGADLSNGFLVRPFLSDANLKLIDYGLSAGFKLGDRASLGVGLSYYQFSFDTITGRFNLPDLTLANIQKQSGDGNKVGFNLGGHFKLTDSLQLGLAYRHAPEFHYDALNFNLLDGNGQPLPSPQLVTRLTSVGFNVPDMYGIGLSWRPTDQLVIDLDVDRMRYSELVGGLQTVFSDAATASQRLKLEDGTELRLGAEYTFAQLSHPFSLRGGVWRDPRHSVFFDGQPLIDDIPSIVKKALFGGSRNHQMHTAIGAGWAFTAFQVDLGADFSREQDIVSLSGVYRF